MKKSLKILIIILVVVVIIGAIYVFDSLRVVEQPLSEVVEIAKQVDGESVNGKAYAYTLDRYEDKIVHTYYFAMYRVKTITTYYIEDEVVKKAYRVNHFTTKAEARNTESDLSDKKINGNIVEGWLELENTNQTANELYNSLETSSDRYLVRLDKNK